MGPKDGRHRRYHGAMAATHKLEMLVRQVSLTRGLFRGNNGG